MRVSVWLAVPLAFVLGVALETHSIVRAQPRIAVLHTMSSALDVFRTGNQQKFTLSRVPAPDGSVLVFVNGSLMLEGEDYTITVTALTFTKQAIGDAPIIQVQYWTAN